MENEQKTLLRNDSPFERVKFGLRLAQLLKKLGMSKKDLAKAAGVSPQTVSNYCAGLHDPKQRFVDFVVDSYRVRREWLMNGVGEVFSAADQDEKPSLREPATSSYEQECIRLKHELADKDRELAAVELAKGRQQGLIFEAIVITCRKLALSDNETQILQLAVMDYERVIDGADTAPDSSRQAAAGI
jgi:transcriptional regulator with XRE-family HTH domain